jgi:hypothetical protein
MSLQVLRIFSKKEKKLRILGSDVALSFFSGLFKNERMKGRTLFLAQNFRLKLR